MMTPRKTGFREGRVDYRWRVDRDGGFEKATLIYDLEGRLVGMDFAIEHVLESPVRERKPDRDQ